MSISIQTNVNSLIAQQNLSVTNKFQSLTIAQLTSGYRINSSGDDAAGLAVANKFRSTVAELTQGVANGNDATAQLQIMDGGMSNISQILDRLKTLATQSASGTFTGNRATLNSEFQADISEIDRQAQSVGLDTGGFFAKSLNVYLGQGTGSGGGNGGSLALANASVTVDLSVATVDAGSLGLKGMKAIAGTVSSTGTDIGTGSGNGTTVQDIVSQLAGNAQAKIGYATFNFAGPGFSGDSKVSVAANLSGVSDTATLVTAINQAIAGVAGGGSQADQALKSAGITATVNTDQFGHQQLAFSSSTTAFQVQAGDQMANALMGNFAAEGSATGKAVTSTVTGGTAGVATAVFHPANVSVQISGAGLAGPVNISLKSSDQVVSDATRDVINQVNQNKQLQDAGISASMTADNKLQFTSATGASFNVSSVGDTTNALGLGTFVTTSALNGAASYSDITAGNTYSAADTGNGIATLGFSLNGGTTGGITAATVTGSVTGVGYNGGGTPNGTVANALGALGTMTITLNGSGTPVTVDFSKDANQSATETAQQAADFINNQIQTQAGYGSDVKLATVDAATKTIVLSGTADGAGTVAASGAAADALGLTAAKGANIVAASGTAGNTVSVNLAADDAKSAVATGTAPAALNVATGTNTLALKIDGVSVNADFSKDVHGAGEAAALTSTALGVNATSTTDVSALQGAAGTVSTANLGSLGVNSVVDVSTLGATTATVQGTSVSTNITTGVNFAAYQAQKAVVTSTSFDVTNADPSLLSLNLGQFAATTAKAIGGTLGSDINSAVDLGAFKATAATTTSTVSLPASGLDLKAYQATQATYTGASVAASDTADMVGALSGLTDSLIISVSDSNATHAKSAIIDIKGAHNLGDVATLINASTAGNLNETNHRITASVVDGALQLTNDVGYMTSGAANKISIVANNASLAVGLSEAGQISNTEKTGVDATKLNLTVSTLKTTEATKAGTSLSNAALATALTGTFSLDITLDNLALVNVDLSNKTTATAVKAAIGAALNAVDSTYRTDGTDVVSGDGTNGITIHSKTAGSAGSLTLGGTAATALGLTQSKIKGVETVGSSTINLDISSETGIDTLVTDINANASTNAGLGAGETIANVVKKTADGKLTFTANNTGAASTINVTHNALSDALGLTSGSVTGVDATKLKVNIDGMGEQAIDVSGATTVGQVATAINTAMSAISGYGGVAAGTTGSLTLTAVKSGAAGTVKIVDNAVSQALHLTPGTTTGVDATKLMLNIDGIGEKGFDISSGVTDLNSLLGKINTQAGHASSGDGFGVGSIAFAGTGDDQGSLVLKSINTGATGASAGNVTIEDNAVSRLLGLTPSGKVNQAGTDSVKLVVQIDGGKEESIDLSSLNGGSPTLTNIKDAINTALHTNQAVLDGYSTSTTYAAANTTGPGNGTLTIQGGYAGDSLVIKNNDLSKALGLATGTDDTVRSRSQQTLNLEIDGHQQVDIVLDTLGASAKLSDIAAAINSTLSAAKSQGYGADYSNVAKANADGTISLTGVLASNTVKVLNSGMSNKLQFTTGNSDAVGTGAAPETLDVSLDGKAVTQVSFAGITGGGTPTLTDIAAKINAALVADTDYGADYKDAAKANADGTITISGAAGGSAAGSVTVTNNVAGKTLGLTSGVAPSVTVNGKDESLADVVSFLNTTAQQALGASTDAQIVSLGVDGKVSIASQSKGAASNVSILSSGTTGGLAGSLNLDVDKAATGQARSLQSVVDELKVAFNTNSTLQQAGLTAQIKQGSLEINSSNGTQFRVDAWGTQNGTNASDLGFGVTGQAFTSANALTPLSTASVIDTQGSSAIGTFANSKNSASISFQNMQFGNDDQSITISANSAAGVAQTPLTITLQNDDQAQTGANVDAAIGAINTKLQQSENATMRSITAVRETAADGSESINFISSLSSFNVSVSSSAGAAVGDGLNGGKAKTFTSAMNGSSSSIAIDTQAGAQQAVLALSAAVAKLGSAQASIGRGENQLGYAINLAQSQISNFSSAESQIRDANVAAQAANLSKAQVLSQASIAAMAQANSAPQAVLALLRG